MNARKWLYLFIALIVTICISAASWLYLWDGLPKKAPLRARQVFLFLPTSDYTPVIDIQGRIEIVIPAHNIFRPDSTKHKREAGQWL